MFKKLQNLLFEDEDEDIEDEEEETSAPVKKAPAAPAVKPAAPAVQPVAKPVAPAVAPAPVVKPAPAPVVKPAEPLKPVAQPAAPVEKPVTKPSLGITVDDVVSEKKPIKAPVKAKPVKKEKKEDANVYQFRPVISPIFGVDEKDMTSLKNTTNKIKENEKAKNDPNVSPIISPMYGAEPEEEKKKAAADEETVTNELLDQIDANASSAAEDDVPEFSLDDILKVRDQEFAEEKREVKAEEAPAFPSLNLDDDDDEVPAFREVEKKAENVKADKADKDARASIENTGMIKHQLFDDDDE